MPRTSRADIASGKSKQNLNQYAATMKVDTKKPVTTPSLMRRALCSVPVGLLPYLFYVGVTAGFSMFLAHHDGFETNDVNKKIIELSFCCWLIFAIFASNTKEARYGILLLPYTAFITKYIRILFLVSDETPNFILYRLQELFAYDANSAVFGTISAILLIVLLVPLYLPFKLLREISAGLLLAFQGVLIYFSLDVAGYTAFEYLSPMGPPSPPGLPVGLPPSPPLPFLPPPSAPNMPSMPTEIDVASNPLGTEVNLLAAYAAAAMYIFASAIENDKTPLAYIYTSLTTRSIPLCSIKVF
jgi:hypothetical protein